MSRSLTDLEMNGTVVSFFTSMPFQCVCSHLQSGQEWIRDDPMGVVFFSGRTRWSVVSMDTSLVSSDCP